MSFVNNTSLENCRILVCEPNFNIRHTIVSFLRSMGAETIHHTASIREAENRLIQEPDMDLIICEWIIDGEEKNGIQFCRQIKQSQPPYQCLFLLIAIESCSSDIILAYEIGVDGYLIIPFNHDTFCQKVQALYKEKLSPSPLNIALKKGYQAIENNQIGKAKICFEEALDLNYESAAARVGLGKVNEIRKKHELAQDFYLKAIKTNPQYMASYTHLMKLFASQNQISEAITWAQKITIMSPDNPSYLLELAHLYLSNNDLNPAYDTFQKVILLSPSLAKAYKGIGDVHFKKQEYDKAIASYNKALDLDEKDLGILNSIGLSYSRQNLYNKALEQFRLALALDANNEKLYFNMAMAYEGLKQKEEALFCYNKALEINPSYRKALEAMDRCKNEL